LPEKEKYLKSFGAASVVEAQRIFNNPGASGSANCERLNETFLLFSEKDKNI